MFDFFKKSKKEVKKVPEEVKLSDEEVQKIKEEINRFESDNTIKDEKYYEELGLLYFKLGEKEKAISNLEKSLEIKPSVGDGYKKLMTLYNGKRADAARNGDDKGIEKYMNKLDDLRQIARKHTI